MSVLALLVSCRRDEDPLAAEIDLSETVPTVAFVRWTPPADGTSWVEYGLDPAALDERTPAVSTSDAEHEQVLLGLKADRTWSWRAVTEVDGQRVESPIGAVTTGSAPPGVAAVALTGDERASQDPARWLLTITNGPTTPSTVVVYDRDGDPVWFREAPSGARQAHTARPSWDGGSFVYGFFGQTQSAEDGGIWRVSLDGRSELRIPTVDAHHDFVERPDGTFAYLSHARRDDVDVEGELADVVSDTIRETDQPDPIYDHLEDSGHPLFWTCVHMREPFGEPPYSQWTHGNSLIPDPVAPEDFYWVNLRYQDALIKVSRADRAIVREIGGRYDDSDLPVDEAFDHGHLSHLWPGGFLMFDNNSHGDDGPSRVREYAYDEPSEHVSLVGQWDGVSTTRGMADARRTEAGTVLLNFPEDRVIQERTDADEVVWELTLAEGMEAGRITLLRDLYDLDDPYEGF